MAVLLTRPWTAADGTQWTAVGFRKVLGADLSTVVTSNTGHCGPVAGARYFLVTGQPQTPGHRLKVDLTWKDAIGSSRVPALLARWSEDGEEGYAAEIDSNLDETRVRIRRRKGGAWDDLTGWEDIFDAPHVIDGAVLEGGVTAELLVQDVTGGVSLELRIAGQSVLSHTDTDADRLERDGTCGVAIDALSTLDDVEYDSLSVEDLEEEYSGLGGLSTGLALVVDGEYFSEADLKAANISIGRGSASFSKDDVWDFATPALVDAADTILYPGAVVTVAIDDTVVAFGRIQPSSRALVPGEGRAYQLMSARKLAAEVPIEHPLTNANSITWNLPPDHADYIPSYANKERGEAIRLLLDEHADGPTGLRAHLAAPPDEDDPPYIQAELDALTDKVPGFSASGDVLTGVEQLLAPTKYALRIDPATRIWRIVPRMGGTIRQLDFDATHMTGTYEIDPRKNRTAILVLGERPQVETTAFDNGIEVAGAGLEANLNKGWPENLEAVTTAEKQKRNKDEGEVESTSGSGASVSVTPTAASLSLDTHEWIEGTIGFLDGPEAGEIYDVEDNTGSAIDVVGPWRNGGPDPGDTFVIQGNGAGGGRDNGHTLIGRRYELADTDLGVGSDVCAHVTITNDRIKAQTTAKVTTPDDPTKPTEVMLDHPSIGLVNYAPQAKPEPCNEGGAIEEARVELNLPTFSRSDPRVPVLWFPSTDGKRGYRGSSFTTDSAKWNGAGRPGKGDVGVQEPEIWNMPEYDGSSEVRAEVEKLCAEQLTFLGPLARSVVLEVKNALRTNIGLGDRLQVLNGPTELESVQDLDVLAIEWDPTSKVTRYYCGTVAAGEYDLQAMRREMIARNVARRNKRDLSQFQTLVNCLAGNRHSAAMAREQDYTQKCAEEVTSGVSKEGRSVKEDFEWFEIWIEEIWDWLTEQKFEDGGTDDDGTAWVKKGGQWYYLDDGGWHQQIANDGPSSKGGSGKSDTDPGAPDPTPHEPDDLGEGSIEGIMWAAIQGILANLGKTIDLQTGKVIAPGTVNNEETNPDGHDWVTFSPDDDADGDPERTPVPPEGTVPPTTEVDPDAFSLLSSIVNGILHNLGKTVSAGGVVLKPGTTVPAGGATRYNPDGSTTPVSEGNPVPDEELTKLSKNKAAMERLLLGHEPGEHTDGGPKITDKPGGGYKVSPAGYEKIDGDGLAGPQIGGAVGGLAGKCGSTFDGAGAFGSGPGTILVPGSTVGEDGGYYHPPTNDEDDIVILEEGHEVPASTQQQALALTRGAAGLAVHDAADIGGVVYTDEQSPREGAARYWRVEPSTLRFREVEEDAGAGLNDGDWAWITPATYYEERDWNPWKRPVRVATAAALAANTKSGTTILEANANGAMALVDGIALAVRDSLLVKDESDASKNGIYVVDSLGSGGSKWKLVRRADADTQDELRPGMLVYVEDGPTNAKNLYRQANLAPLVPHTDAQAWEEYSSASGPAGDFMADGSVPATGDFDMDGNKITDLDDPASAQDAATKAYVDAKTQLVPFTFLRTNVAANQTALIVNGPNNGQYYPAPEAGAVVKVAAHFTGTFTTGQIKFRARKNGSGDATVELTLSATGSGVASGSGVSLSLADLLGCELDTDATFNGTVGTWMVTVYLAVALP